MDNSVKFFLTIVVICFVIYGLFDSITTAAMLSKDGEAAQTSAINLNFALFLAERGYKVVPLDFNNTPYFENGLLEHGWDSATTDSSLIKKWWHQWPDAAAGFIDGGQNNVLRWDITLTESSDVLRYFLKNFGIYGFLGIKLIITLIVIGGCLLSLRIYPRIIWVVIMVLLALSFIGLIAGLSNLYYLTVAVALGKLGISYENLYNTILVICFAIGIVLTAMTMYRAAGKAAGLRECSGQSPSDEYVIAKYLH